MIFFNKETFFVCFVVIIVLVGVRARIIPVSSVV
jgi:hypothetical protein